MTGNNLKYVREVLDKTINPLLKENEYTKRMGTDILGHDRTVTARIVRIDYVPAIAFVFDFYQYDTKIFNAILYAKYNGRGFEWEMDTGSIYAYATSQTDTSIINSILNYFYVDYRFSRVHGLIKK